MLREARGWTRSELARRVDVTFQTIKNWEADQYEPRSEKITKLAREFDVTESVLRADAHHSEEGPHQDLKIGRADSASPTIAEFDLSVAHLLELARKRLSTQTGIDTGKIKITVQFEP